MKTHSFSLIKNNTGSVGKLSIDGEWEKNYCQACEPGLNSPTCSFFNTPQIRLWCALPQAQRWQWSEWNLKPRVCDYSPKWNPAPLGVEVWSSFIWDNSILSGVKKTGWIKVRDDNDNNNPTKNSIKKSVEIAFTANPDRFLFIACDIDTERRILESLWSPCFI